MNIPFVVEKEFLCKEWRFILMQYVSILLFKEKNTPHQ